MQGAVEPLVEMYSPIQGKIIQLKDALSRIPGPAGLRFAELFKHGTLSLEIYAPKGNDPQDPHTRDEVYIVVTGRGEFVFGDQSAMFGPAISFLCQPVRCIVSRNSLMTWLSGCSSTVLREEKKVSWVLFILEADGLFDCFRQLLQDAFVAQKHAPDFLEVATHLLHR